MVNQLKLVKTKVSVVAYSKNHYYCGVFFGMCAYVSNLTQKERLFKKRHDREYIISHRYDVLALYYLVILLKVKQANQLKQSSLWN